MTADRRLTACRVLELPGCTAGSYAGRLLAGLGADVVVVEIEGKVESRRRRAFFHCGKKSVLVPDGARARRRLKELEAAADVVLAPAGSSAGEKTRTRITEAAGATRPVEIAFEGVAMVLRALTAGDLVNDDGRHPRPAEAEARRAITTPSAGPTSIWPQGLYRAADGWVVAGPGPHTRDTVLRLVASQGPEEWDDAEAALEQWVIERERQDVFQTAQLWRLAFAPVLTFREAAGDPHFVESAAFLDSADPTFPVPKPPFNWSGMPVVDVAPDPGAGGHVLAEWRARDVGEDDHTESAVAQAR